MSILLMATSKDLLKSAFIFSCQSTVPKEAQDGKVREAGVREWGLNWETQVRWRPDMYLFPSRSFTWPEPSPDCNQSTALRVSWPKGKNRLTCKALPLGATFLMSWQQQTWETKKKTPSPEYVSVSSLSIFPSSYPSTCIPTSHPSTHLSICPSIIHPSVHSPIFHRFTHPSSIYLLVHPNRHLQSILLTSSPKLSHSGGHNRAAHLLTHASTFYLLFVFRTKQSRFADM